MDLHPANLPSPPVTAAESLLDLLQRQRQALLRLDPEAITDLEAGTLRLEQALAASSRSSLPGLPRISPDEIATLRRQLQNNQATLLHLAAGNRRALNALFGEPALYSR